MEVATTADNEPPPPPAAGGDDGREDGGASGVGTLAVVEGPRVAGKLNAESLVESAKRSWTRTRLDRIRIVSHANRREKDSLDNGNGNGFLCLVFQFTALDTE